MEGVPTAPDVLLTGAGVSLLYHSGIDISPNTPTDIEVPMDPYYWVLPSGAPVDRPKLMVVLNNLEGVYVRASYGMDRDGQARLSDVSLDSAFEVPAGKNLTEEDQVDLVTSVELCFCPEGYYGYSCESCALGYFK